MLHMWTECSGVGNAEKIKVLFHWYTILNIYGQSIGLRAYVRAIVCVRYSNSWMAFYMCVYMYVGIEDDDDVCVKG